jgi:AcrR family transcriptional regulator
MEQAMEEANGGDAAAAADDGQSPAVVDDNDDDAFEPCGLRSRRREKKRFRSKALKRSECFLCAYVGERNTTLASEEVNVMVEMIRRNTGRMESAILAEMVADYYERFRERVNARLEPGEPPLPRMTAPTVLDHIRRHHQDPEVKKLVQLEELQEMREELLDVVLERSKRTKRVRANKTQVDCLEKIIKLEWMVQGKDLDKMIRHEPGARVQSGAGEPGSVVATQGKTLYDFWRRKRGRN